MALFFALAKGEMGLGEQATLSRYHGLKPPPPLFLLISPNQRGVVFLINTADSPTHPSHLLAISFPPPQPLHTPPLTYTHSSSSSSSSF